MLGQLRLLEGATRFAGEDRRRVVQRRVEPEPVEIVADVVVRTDVAPAAGPAVGAQPVQTVQHPLGHAAAVEAGVEGVTVQRREGQQAGEVGRIPQAVAVGLAKADIAAPGKTPEQRIVVHFEVRLGSRARARETQPLATREFQVEAAVGDALQSRQQRAQQQRGRDRRGRGLGRDTGGHDVVSSRGGRGLPWKATPFSQRRSACQ